MILMIIFTQVYGYGSVKRFPLTYAVTEVLLWPSNAADTYFPTKLGKQSRTEASVSKNKSSKLMDLKSMVASV